MKIELNKSIKNKYKILCVNCKHETNHVVLSSVDISAEENWNGDIFYWWAKYQIVKCKGCDEVSFRNETANSEDYDPYTGNLNVNELIFPRREKNTINVKKFMNIPYNLHHLYKEVIDCYNNSILILCAAGVRALVEGLCKDKKILDGEIMIKNKDGSEQAKRVDNLQGKINGLYENGIVTKENADVLHNHRFLGNQAIHELMSPSKDELYLAISTIEVILESIYEIPAKSKELNRLREKKNAT